MQHPDDMAMIDSSSCRDALDLQVVPMTAAAFARYGEVLQACGRDGRAINDGTAHRFDLPAPQLHAQGGHAALALFRARAQSPVGPWHELERHRLGTQSFVPLAGTRCIVLVALGADRPDPATLAAFCVAGQHGFTLHVGTWHHPLIALDDGDFIVIERGAADADCQVLPLERPVRLIVD